MPSHTMASPLPLRVGLAAHSDPRDPQADSGVTNAVFEAMAEVVAEVVPISGQLPLVSPELPTWAASPRACGRETYATRDEPPSTSTALPSSGARRSQRATA